MCADLTGIDRIGSGGQVEHVLGWVWSGEWFELGKDVGGGEIDAGLVDFLDAAVAGQELPDERVGYRPRHFGPQVVLLEARGESSHDLLGFDVGGPPRPLDLVAEVHLGTQRGSLVGHLRVTGGQAPVDTRGEGAVRGDGDDPVGVHDPAVSPAIAEQAQGFVYVGAAVLILVGVAAIVLGVLQPGSGRAEATAMLGLFGYALYGVVAVVAGGAIHRQTRLQGHVPPPAVVSPTSVSKSGEVLGRSTPLQPLPPGPQHPADLSVPQPDESDSPFVASPVPGREPSVDDPD